MKIDVDEERNIRLREVFNGVKLETSEGNAIGVCMRDDTLEINVMPGGKHTGNWWRVNMQTGDIDPMPQPRPGLGAPNDQAATSERSGDSSLSACSVPPCDKCGAVQTELGGIEFGPPHVIPGLPGMWCRKLHICTKCTSVPNAGGQP